MPAFHLLTASDTKPVNSASSEDREAGFFGFNAEIRQQRATKFASSKHEGECRAWLLRMLGAQLEERCGTGGLEQLHSGLKDGVLLCSLANLLRQGVCARVNDPCKNVLQERENVEAFIAALEQMRVRPEERITAADLHSGRDMIAVVDCLMSLKRVAETGRGAWDPQRESLNRPLCEEVDAGPAVNRASGDLTERGFFGVSAEIQERLEAKLDPERVRSALYWLNNLLKRSEVPQVFELHQLVDGVVLCAVANLIQPGAVPRIHKASKIKMLQRENIQLFLSAAARLGVPSASLFSITDLSEMKYPVGVVDTIFALARAAASRPGFSGIRLEVARGKPRLRSVSGKRSIAVPSDLTADPIFEASDSKDQLVNSVSSIIQPSNLQSQRSSINSQTSSSKLPSSSSPEPISPRRVRFSDAPPSPVSPRGSSATLPPSPTILRKTQTQFPPPEDLPTPVAAGPFTTTSSLVIFVISSVVLLASVIYFRYFGDSSNK